MTGSAARLLDCCLFNTELWIFVFFFIINTNKMSRYESGKRMEIVSVIGSLKACKHIRNKTLFSKAVSMIKKHFWQILVIP